MKPERADGFVTPLNAHRKIIHLDGTSVVNYNERDKIEMEKGARGGSPIESFPGAPYAFLS